jgi:hypothetical protein
MITDIAIVLTALSAGGSGLALLLQVSSFANNLDRYRVPRSWWPWLGTAKLAGAVGVLLGFWQPTIGVVAAACLVAYFAGAVVTVLRAKVYGHVPIPLVYLAVPAVTAALLATS